VPSTCHIGGLCYKDGAAGPVFCNTCSVSASTSAWTIKTGLCRIGSVCREKGDRDATSCSWCDPAASQSAWATIPNQCKIGGSQCQAKGTKHTGGCAECDPTASTTSWTVKGTTHCLINDTCVTSGTKDPSGCRHCDPTSNRYDWVQVPGICNIDGRCITAGTKHPAGCAECDPSTSTTSWTVKGNTHCLINNTCYTSGTTVGCNKCDPSVSKTAWTPVTPCSRELDVGKHSSTYTGTLTRGFWFTAPVKFTIVGLRVPTDVGTAAQNVQVVKFASPPPTYSASTTAHTTLAYHRGVAGSSWISVNIPVARGDIIGILGARGGSTMSNSYSGSNPYNSTIAGAAVKLTRLVYQANLYITRAGPLSTENGGSFGRVEVKYVP
jgi:hypothetical protein